MHVFNDKDSGTKAARMTDEEYALWAGDGYKAEYAGFWIKPKKDFGSGFWDAPTRRHVKEGWVICKDGCNAMPGATWAHNLAEAHQMIDAFMAVDCDGQKFWHLLRAINAVEPEQPRKKQRGEVSFIMGDPELDREEIDKFLEGVEGCIEDSSSIATSYIYKVVTENYGRAAYEQEGMGHMHTVGHVGDMPVCVSLFCNRIRGHRILFVEPTSRVVDHKMVRDWIESVLPQTAWNEGRQQFRISDANNWPNAIPN